MKIFTLDNRHAPFRLLGFTTAIELTDMFSERRKFLKLGDLAIKLFGPSISPNYIRRDERITDAVWSYDEKKYTLYFKDEATLTMLLLKYEIN